MRIRDWTLSFEAALLQISEELACPPLTKPHGGNELTTKDMCQQYGVAMDQYSVGDKYGDREVFEPSRFR